MQVMKAFLVALILVSCCISAKAQSVGDFRVRSSTDPALSGEQRIELMLKSNFLSPGAYLRSLGPALGGQLSDSPKEWDKDLGGFGRRFGTQFAIQSSRGLIRSGAAAAFGLDPRYQRCDCSGGWRRTGHAFSGLWMGANGKGERRFDPSNLMSAYGGGYVGASLYPDRYRLAVNGYQLGSQQVGQIILQNLLLEFSPELKRFRKKVFRR